MSRGIGVDAREQIRRRELTRDALFDTIAKFQQADYESALVLSTIAVMHLSHLADADKAYAMAQEAIANVRAEIPDIRR